MTGALKYSKERKQFGKAISDFQGDPMEASGYGHRTRRRLAADMRAASMKDARP